MIDLQKIETLKIKIFNNANTREEKGEIAFSMLSEERMDNIYFCLKEVIENNVPGDFIETGVWRGGACIFARSILKEYGINDRIVWACDSFEGFPENTHAVDRQYNIEWRSMEYISVSLEDVKSNFESFGVLDDGVQFVKGFFCDTMPTLPVEKIAVLRLDGDMYASTIDVLNNLYHKVSPGGFVIIDDYGMGVDTAKDAVHDFRKEHNIQSPLIPIDSEGIYWKVYPSNFL